MEQTWIKLLEDQELKYHILSIVEALSEDEYLWLPYFTIDDVVAALENGMYQGWAGGTDDEAEIYAITQVHTYPRAKVLSVLWCHGENAEEYYGPFSDQLTILGRIIKADIIEIRGRKGWSRELQSHGFTPTQLILVKEVTPWPKDSLQT